MNKQETQIVYYLNDDNIPYFIKTNIPVIHMTLRDFKDLLKKNDQSYRYFFQAKDEHLGFVKKEIVDDNEQLPYENNRILCWINSKVDAKTETSVAIQTAINDIEELAMNRNSSSLSLSSMSEEQDLPVVLTITIDDQVSPSKFETELCRLKQEFIQKLFKQNENASPTIDQVEQELDHLVEEILQLKIKLAQSNQQTDVQPPFQLNDEIEAKIVKMNAPPHHISTCAKTFKHGKFVFNSLFKKEKAHQSGEHHPADSIDLPHIGRFRRHEHFRRKNLKTRISSTLDEIRDSIIKALRFE